MPSTLAQLQARIAARLVDASNAIFALATIDEALRSALHDYSAVQPLVKETLITLPGNGREIALNNVTGLLAVLEAWWPYDSTSDEVWPPPRLPGWRVWWDDGQPVLFLDIADGDQPQLNDELRLWYTVLHTIQNLDSAATTTVRPDHETILVTGAAGYAALSEALDQAGQIHIDPNEVDYLKAWGTQMIDRFEKQLARLPKSSPTTPRAYGPKWPIDKWDT